MANVTIYSFHLTLHAGSTPGNLVAEVAGYDSAGNTVALLQFWDNKASCLAPNHASGGAPEIAVSFTESQLPSVLSVLNTGKPVIVHTTPALSGISFKS